MGQAKNHNPTRDADSAWELMKKIGVAMPVTRDGDNREVAT
jgi:hypothetical protein